MTIWRVNLQERDRFGDVREFNYRLVPDAYRRVQEAMFRACADHGDDVLITVTAKNGEGLTLMAENMAWSRVSLLRFQDTMFEAVEASAREEVY